MSQVTDLAVNTAASGNNAAAIQSLDDRVTAAARWRRQLRPSHTAGASVDGYTLTLAANPWNIARTCNLTPGRELLFACRYRLGTASNFVVYMSEADNIYDPLYGSLPGCLEHCQMYFTDLLKLADHYLTCELGPSA